LSGLIGWKGGLLLPGAVILYCLVQDASRNGSAQAPDSDAAANPSRHVLLITIDTLRADHLDVYGYRKAQAPVIARLARDGVLFENAVSPVPLTLPSHCSIFTGTYPAYHGVRDHSGFALSPRSETIATSLRARGFATGAFVGAFVLDSRFGMDLGFDYYYDRFDSTRSKAGSLEGLERRAEQVSREALRWMELQAGRSFFAWLHFYDPHAPYAPPEPFKTRYAGNPYDGEIAYTDSVVGKVLDFLIRKNWYQNALIVLTSDHGEDLGDHGENTHGYFVYDSTVRVPLIIKLPGGKYAGKAISSQVRTIDIFPTVLQILRAPSVPQVQGRGLFPLIALGVRRSAENAYGETYYPYYHFGWSPLRYIRTDRLKFIDAPQPELYDIVSDPAETKNLEASHSALANELRDRLRAAYSRFRSQPSSKKEETDPATLEKLRSLGYVTYLSRTSGEIETGLPDPKAKLQIYNLFQQALLQSAQGAPQAAIRKFEEVLRLEPKLIDARIQLGLLLKNMGEYARAVEELKLALQADSSNAIASYNLAHAYASWGKLDEAMLGFKRTLELDPREVRARIGLGIGYQTRGAAQEAEREYRAALAIDSGDTTALNNLGGIYLSQRDPVKALAELRRSLDSDSRRADTHNLMGSALWLHDEPEKALLEFREAIRLDNHLVDAYLNLGMLLNSLKRTQEALGYLTSAAEIAPRSARVFEILGEAYRSAGLDAAAEKALSRARELARNK
jgi:arylsulfatase A-like enzyme/Tfp pilus assembly protein PilF